MPSSEYDHQPHQHRHTCPRALARPTLCAAAAAAASAGDAGHPTFAKLLALN